MFVLVGFTDDVAVLARHAAFRMIQGHITDRHYEAADLALTDNPDIADGVRRQIVPKGPIPLKDRREPFAGARRRAGFATSPCRAGAPWTRRFPNGTGRGKAARHQFHLLAGDIRRVLRTWASRSSPSKIVSAPGASVTRNREGS